MKLLFFEIVNNNYGFYFRAFEYGKNYGEQISRIVTQNVQ